MAERQEGEKLGYGSVKTPGGHYIDPLGSIANAEDINAIAGNIQDIQWGAAQLNRGVSQAKNHKASIIGMAKANVFEFPVFFSDSVPLEFATATNTLLEQVYAAYLQMAISINPVVDYKMVQARQDTAPFSKYKTDTTKYIECVDLSFQKDSCHNVIYNDDDNVMFEFEMCSIEDSDARIMLEALDYQPLSEFDHYFMEASNQKSDADLLAGWTPFVYFNKNTGELQCSVPEIGQNGHVAIDRTTGNAREYVMDVTTNGGTQVSQAFIDLMDQIGDIKNDNSITINVGGTDRTFTAGQLELNKTAQEFIKLARDNDPDGDIRKKQAADAKKTEAEQETAQRKNAAGKKTTDDLFNADGTVKDLKNMDAETRQAVRDTFDILDRESKNAAERNTIEELKTAFNNGTIKDAQLDRLTRIIRANREILQNNDAQRKYHVDGVGDITHEEIKGRLSAEELSDLEAAKRARRSLITSMNKVDSEGHLTQNAAELRKQFGVSSSLNNMRVDEDVVDSILRNAATRGELIKNKNLANQYDAYLRFTEKHGKTPDDVEYESKHEREEREKRREIFETKASKAPQFLDESKLKKMNTMKPLMMTVNMSIMAQDGHVSHPMEYVVGVRTHCRIIKASTLPEVVEYPIKEMNKISRKAKWRAGELKFWKDIMFHIKEKKQTAIDSKDPNRKWYRRLYELAHMKGDGNVSRKIAGAGSTDGLIPNATVVISKSDVDNIEEVTKIDMLKASNAIDFCQQLFLIGFIVIDQDRQAIKILIPELNNEYDVMSLGAVNKQIAELDTVGMATRDLFKALR